VPIGGSIKGTTLAFGEYGLRVRGNGARITAKQLQSAEVALKRTIKVVKGAEVWMRLFPDIPVCVKVGALSCSFLVQLTSSTTG
jgi:ribosomal protein L16